MMLFRPSSVALLQAASAAAATAARKTIVTMMTILKVVSNVGRRRKNKETEKSNDGESFCGITTTGVELLKCSPDLVDESPTQPSAQRRDEIK